jgi:hypothetical protein
MAENHLEIRRKTYFNISSHIARLDNTQLHSLLDNSKSNESSTGWGSSQTIAVGESQVFVKKIPVTNLEYDNLYSTKNLYNLPTYCNYGLGSTGFGVFRELIAHFKTTNWVLEGSIATFPLLYHYRIIPCSKQCIEVDLEQLKDYVEYWGNSVNAGNYWVDRANANYELVLFLEYVPHVLDEWLQEHPHKLQQSLDDIRQTLDFLRSKGIIHFDAHFRNILTDGDRIYLTDFGLVLDKSFGLTKDEASFFERNKFYDYGEVLRNLGHLIRPAYDRCSDEQKRQIIKKYAIEENSPPYRRGAILLDNIEQIHADRDIELDNFYVASIVKYRGIVVLLQDFFADIAILFDSPVY